MKLSFRCVFFSLVMCLALLTQAYAAGGKQAVVLPFSGDLPPNMSYLSRAVPAAVQNKLQMPGILTAKSAQGKASSAAEARRAMGSADYAVFGHVGVSGNNCTITLNSVDKAGKTWSKTETTSLNNLTSTVQNMTQAMANEGLGVSLAQSASRGAAMTPGSNARAGQAVPRGSGASSDIIVNETGQQYYLNPQFRYQGASAGDASRLRSPRLKIKMIDMAVDDFNGDGKNEIAILDQHHLYMHIWDKDGRLREIGKVQISQSNVNFCMRAIDLNRDGAKELVITTYDESKNRPYTFFYSFKNNRFNEYCEKCAYFCSVVRLSPTFTPTLVGQGWDSLKLFAPGVHNMVRVGKTFGLGSRLNLPKEANVFNFCWLPGSRGSDGDKLIVLRDDERLKIFSGHGNSAIHTTMEKFSGTAVGMEHYKGMPGLGVDKTYQLPDKYYAPMRFITVDLGHTGEYVLLMNKPVSTAAQFFDRYRYFPQGEIHALYWDGVGLALKWKTRRIRGSVGQIALADANNDGVLDLVVGINSSPDLGIGNRQCMVVAYPLNTSATNPNAPIDMSDFEVSPNR